MIRSDDGDTLVELLVALVIISITVVSLLGALTTSITSSAEHRTLATTDSLLKSFAEAAKYDVQLQSGALFTNCTGSAPPSDYRVVSTPNPASGPMGTPVTVFVTGFAHATNLSVTVGGHAAQTVSATGAPTTIATNAQGNATATFVIPSSGFTAGSTQTVAVSDGTGTDTPTGFTIQSGTAPAGSTSVLAKYSLAISAVQDWDATAAGGPKFDSSCTSSGLQQVTTVITAPNNLTDTLSFVVIDPVDAAPPLLAPTVAVTAPSNPPAFSALTFTATVTPPVTTTGRPTGNITWSFLSSPVSSCTTTTALVPASGNAVSATCTVSASAAAPGTYDVTASYSGDGTYASANGTDTVSVAKVAVTDVVTNSSPTTLGSTITFTATVTAPSGDPTPSGALTWTITGPVSTCASTTGPTGAANVATYTCVIAASGAGTYTAKAAYPGNSDYTAVNSNTDSITVSKVVPTVSYPTPGKSTTLTFTATFTGPSGAPTPTGTVTWSITVTSGSAPTCGNSTLTSLTNVATCTIYSASSSVTYTVTYNYGGDGNYTSASAADNQKG